MAEVAPSARVRNAQDLLLFLDERTPGFRADLLERLPQTTRELLEASARTTWIPLEEDACFNDHLVAMVGSDSAVDIWTDYTARFVDSPLQRAIFEGARRLFGLTPGGLARVVPLMWTTSFRNCGVVDVQPPDESAVTMMFREMPEQMMNSDSYMLLLRGIGRGLLRLCHVDEAGLAVDLDRSKSTIALTMSW